MATRKFACAPRLRHFLRSCPVRWFASGTRKKIRLRRLLLAPSGMHLNVDRKPENIGARPLFAR